MRSYREPTAPTSARERHDEVVAAVVVAVAVAVAVAMALNGDADDAERRSEATTRQELRVGSREGGQRRTCTVSSAENSVRTGWRMSGARTETARETRRLVGVADIVQ